MTVRFAFPALQGQGLAGILKNLKAAVLRWQDRARQRHALLAMDERMLKDLGISRLDAQRAAREIDLWRVGR